MIHGDAVCGGRGGYPHCVWLPCCLVEWGWGRPSHVWHWQVFHQNTMSFNCSIIYLLFFSRASSVELVLLWCVMTIKAGLWQCYVNGALMVTIFCMYEKYAAKMSIACLVVWYLDLYEFIWQILRFVRMWLGIKANNFNKSSFTYNVSSIVYIILYIILLSPAGFRKCSPVAAFILLVAVRCLCYYRNLFTQLQHHQNG